MLKSEVMYRLHDKRGEILDRFDWEKAQSIYRFLGWKWGFGVGAVFIPTVEDLKRAVDELFKTCLRDIEKRLANNIDYKDGGLPASFCSTGGLVVSLTDYGELSLGFHAVEKSTLILDSR